MQDQHKRERERDAAYYQDMRTAMEAQHARELQEAKTHYVKHYEDLMRAERRKASSRNDQNLADRSVLSLNIQDAMDKFANVTSQSQQSFLDEVMEALTASNASIARSSS
jgi:hypothetical protein